MQPDFEYLRYENWREGKEPNWHKIDVELKSYHTYIDIVDWIYDNIDCCERHARWIWPLLTSPIALFKFRYERDYIVFSLRWG